MYIGDFIKFLISRFLGKGLSMKIWNIKVPLTQDLHLDKETNLRLYSTCK